MKNQQLIIGGIVLIALAGGLFVSGQAAKPQITAYWPGTTVGCLPQGHENLAQHIHPTFKMTVDGVDIPTPANVGISSTCMAEIHTHDETGTIHIETVEAGKVLTLNDFLSVGNQALEKDGFTYVATVNGEVVEDIGTYPLKDHDAVVIAYSSAVSE